MLCHHPSLYLMLQEAELLLSAFSPLLSDRILSLPVRWVGEMSMVGEAELQDDVVSVTSPRSAEVRDLFRLWFAGWQRTALT